MLISILFVLLPGILVLVGIYRLLSKLIDKNKKTGPSGNPQQNQQVYENRQPVQTAPPVEKKQSAEPKHTIEPAKECPKCGGHLTGTDENCVYCGASIPQNILFNKERILEMKMQEFKIREKEFEYQLKLKEMSQQSAKEQRQEDHKKIQILVFAFVAFMFFLLLVGLMSK